MIIENLLHHVEKTIFDKGLSIFIIYGPTGVGKTESAIKLAQKVDAEIINCDMAQIFKEGKIGTGQIPEKERGGVEHHLFGFLGPINFTVYEMRLLVETKIKEIISRNKNVILVGGSGFLILSLFFIPISFYEKNYNLHLHKSKDMDLNDSVYAGSNKKREKIVYFPLYLYNIIYLDILSREKWREKVKARVDYFFEKGLVAEFIAMPQEWKQFLFKKGFIGYKQLVENSGFEMEEIKKLIFFSTCQYGKKQRTFMRKMIRALVRYKVDIIFFCDGIYKNLY